MTKITLDRMDLVFNDGGDRHSCFFFLRPPYDQTIKKKQNRKKYLHFSKLSRLQNKIMVMDHHLKKAILYNFYSEIKKKGLWNDWALSVVQSHVTLYHYEEKKTANLNFLFILFMDFKLLNCLPWFFVCNSSHVYSYYCF